MTTIQIALLVVGVLIALSAYGKEMIMFASKPFINQTPEVEVPISPDRPDPREIDVDSGFSFVVEGWETFVNTLIRHDMPECAEDMKDLLVKMAQEYRSELNDKEVEVEKPKSLGGGEAENLAKILEAVQDLKSKAGEKK